MAEALLEFGEGHTVAEGNHGERVAQGHGSDGTFDSSGGGEFSDASFDTAGRKWFGGVEAGEDEIVGKAETFCNPHKGGLKSGDFRLKIHAVEIVPSEVAERAGFEAVTEKEVNEELVAEVVGGIEESFGFGGG